MIEFPSAHTHTKLINERYLINNLPAFNIWLKIFSWIWIMMISWSANLSINLPIKSWLMQGFGWRNLLHEDFQWKTKKGIQVRWFAYKLPRNGNKKSFLDSNSRYKLYRNTHISAYLKVYHILSYICTYNIQIVL